MTPERLDHDWAEWAARHHNHNEQKRDIKQTLILCMSLAGIIGLAGFFAVMVFVL